MFLPYGAKSGGAGFGDGYYSAMRSCFHSGYNGLGDNPPAKMTPSVQPCHLAEVYIVRTVCKVV